MTPTLATKGDVVLLDMSAPYRWRAARRYGDSANTVLAVGDVVTLSKPTDRRVSIIKRIGGMVCALTPPFPIGLCLLFLLTHTFLCAPRVFGRTCGVERHPCIRRRESHPT